MSKRKAQQASGIVRRTAGTGQSNPQGGSQVGERKQELSIKQAREERRRRAQQQRERAQRRARLRTLFISSGVVVLFLLLLGGGAYFLIHTGSQGQQSQVQSQDHPIVDAAYPPVDQVYCDASEQVAVHYHAHLSIYINGQAMQIPANTGIAGDCIYWLHTHDTTGVIHIEAPQNARFTLGQFFDIWKSQFAGLGNGFPSQLDQASGWSVYVDGKPYQGDFHSLQLQAHELITLAYNSPHVQPDTVYNWGSL
ncbi:MAG: hypothetical protein IRZ31_05615 [Thermogemmatispora sp.]|uniref:hypothetical protein n=1 Tax=Thermogemmatispora sp. TaxID=1968838 RepID=UPI002637FB03|nr:hypothetical protein [Thermogemmatispora sp.]MBX5456361.1 hypothetical protein [Thermogemmatispora sp.]